MYRRPPFYHSPYVYNHSLDDYNFGPAMEHVYKPNVSPYYSGHNETPFKQLSKPIQPMNWSHVTSQQHFSPYEYASFYHSPQRPPRQSIMTQFQNEEGQVDINKMLSTVGQLVHTVQQITPMIKQFGSVMKNFR